MNLKFKLLMDRLLGKVVCWMLFPVVRLVGILASRDHSTSAENVRCVVVAKYFGLGSIIHATPMLRAIKSIRPDVKTIFLTRKANRDLFKHLVDIDEVKYLDDSSPLGLVFSMISICFSLARSKVDVFFDLEVHSSFGALMSLFSLARNRVGFYAGRPSDFKCYLYNTLLYFNTQMPLRHCYLQLVKTAGAQGDSLMELSEMRLDDKTDELGMQDKLHALASGARIGKDSFLAININASELSYARRWSKERFAETARRFAENGYWVLFVGSPGEREYVQSAVDLLDGVPRVCNAAGVFQFSEFLHLLKNCEALLTNDTGIMNMGYALRMRVLSLFGPVNPVQYHIPANNTDVIYKQLYCSPCLHITEQIPCYYLATPPCMDLVSVDEVVSKLDNLLNKPAGPYQVTVNSALFQEGRIPFGVMRSGSYLK